MKSTKNIFRPVIINQFNTSPHWYCTNLRRWPPSHDSIITFNENVIHSQVRNYSNIRLNHISDLCRERLPESMKTRACLENRLHKIDNMRVLSVSFIFNHLCPPSCASWATNVTILNCKAERKSVSDKVQWLGSFQFILIGCLSWSWGG